MLQLLFILFVCPVICLSQIKPYQDLSHYSSVFGKTKIYRLYLPDNYYQSTGRYPVIYFFHGWGGRYYKDDSAKLDYEKLGDLVNKYQIIVVMWDGNMDESEPRPYNIGNHEDVKYQIQMKDYFPELVDYIDATYRTLTDRDHRGIIGFSMGGFMSSFIAGKYPDKISVIVDMVGSPEFFVGYPDNHTLYPVRYTLENLKDVSFRLHNMDNCPLYYLNTEIKNAVRWEGLDNFKYWRGHGDHKVDDPGETKVFESAVRFICNQFNHPLKPNRAWSHLDLYEDFNMWGYSVKSNKSEPGFLSIRNVSPTGFGYYTHQWLPDGPPVDCISTITTSPVYKAGKWYDILLYKKKSPQPVLLRKKADKKGCLQIDLSGDGYEVSISDKTQPNDFIILDCLVNGDKKFVEVNGDNYLNINLLSRGAQKPGRRQIQVKVRCTDSATILSNAIQTISLDKNDRVIKCEPIKLLSTKEPPTDATPAWLRLKVEISSEGEDHMSEDALTVPVLYDVPYFPHIKIDDGVAVRDEIIGIGNGNGYAEASEKIMIYENGQRLRLYTDDPYVDINAEMLYDEMLSTGIWPDGYTLSSVVKIADDCPSGHEIEFLAHYETKTFMPINRQVVWGKVKIVVK